jgi:hypothetical protein
MEKKVGKLSGKLPNLLSASLHPHKVSILNFAQSFRLLILIIARLCCHPASFAPRRKGIIISEMKLFFFASFFRPPASRE